MNTKNAIILILMIIVPTSVSAEPILEKQPAPTIPIAGSIAQQSNTLGTLLFESGSTLTAAWSMQALEAIGEQLSQGDGKAHYVLIEGHADDSGNHYVNQFLSELRALHVKRYLVSVHNVDNARIHAIGLGDAVFSGIPKSASTESRKVVISVLDRAEQTDTHQD